MNVINSQIKSLCLSTYFSIIVIFTVGLLCELPHCEAGYRVDAGPAQTSFFYRLILTGVYISKY